MRNVLARAARFLDLPLDGTSRALLVAAAVVVVAVYFFPLWNMTMFAPQYPDGLRMDIYASRLEGGNAGQDVREINVLNHYIGMHEIAEPDFTEFKWIPFVVGALALLFLRAAVHGRMSNLVDVFVLMLYFAAFSLGSFAIRLYSYGHNLSEGAPVSVPPFMPPLFGYKQLANFEVYSYPQLGSYALGLATLLLAFALVRAWWRDRAVAAAGHALAPA
jgi:hypothetical protein